MMKDFRMETFVSKDIVKPISLHVYELHSQKIDNKYSIIRGATRKIINCNQVGVFEDGQNIYTTEKIDEKIPNADFTLEYKGYQKLEVLLNKKVYSAAIKYFIKQNLSKIKVMEKYRKYSCQNDITSKWIMIDKVFGILHSANKEIYLERKYNIWVDILENGKACLKISTSSIFTSALNVSDYIQRGINPIGMEVKNDWGKNTQTGKLVEISNLTVTDKLDFADSLKMYYIVKNEGYRVEKLPDDTPIVKVELQPGSVYPYYPQALKPVLTREKVGQFDPKFSCYIEPYIKRDMKTRLLLDKDFIKDIGELTQISNLGFETEPCTLNVLGYRKATVSPPILHCGDGKIIGCGEEYKIFNCGFYRKPEKDIKICYIYPKNAEDKMKEVANAIYSFAKLGKYQGKEDPYIKKGLLNIQRESIINAEYELGDMTDYKRVANRLINVENVDLAIAIVPDGLDEDGPYNPFKTIWAKANIPSQMISMKTAEIFSRGKMEGNKSKYYLQNIVLGILGKAGGVPWVIKDIPGNVNCFVGLDVATVAKGIHYPACSVVFDGLGQLLGFYKPTTPQQGEKIGTKLLQDIYDQVILAYEDKFGKIPQNIVIHRDGFHNEDIGWYQEYFGKKGINFSIIEIRKNIGSKLIYFTENNVLNPPLGSVVYNDKEAYLVTTDMKNKKGSPNPLLIEKRYGDMKMSDIITQVFYLSQLHVGSVQKMRLPITTGYADKICKNREYVPEGEMSNRLFFL